MGKVQEGQRVHLYVVVIYREVVLIKRVDEKVLFDQMKVCGLIHTDMPQRDEKNHRNKFQSFRKGTTDQSSSDDS